MITTVKRGILMLLILRGGVLFSQNEIFVASEAQINTPFKENHPVYFANGILYLSSNPAMSEGSNDDEVYATMMLSRMDVYNILQKPIKMSQQFSSNQFYGSFCLNKEGSKVYFSKKGKIYSAEKAIDGWKKIEKLPFNDNAFDCSFPSISADGKKLYFASNSAAGFGGMDLYVSTWLSGEWSSPVNLGSKVNTPKDEISPYIHPDGKLYFATNGRKGLGAFDIYATQKVDSGWVKPQILPQPINSSANDYGIIISEDKKTGYFVSNRACSKGEDDIFNFTCTLTLDDPIREAIEDLYAESGEETQGNTEGGDSMQELPLISRILPKSIEYALPPLESQLHKIPFPLLETKPLSFLSAEKEVVNETKVEADDTLKVYNTAKPIKINQKYLVIVGTYAQKENAQVQKKKVENLGFEYIEIVHYNDTKLYGVCVQRFEGEKEALSYAKNIVHSKKIDAFVKILR